MTTESFFTESQTIETVAYNFIVMGEAARHIPPKVEAPNGLFQAARRRAGGSA